jgi:hypothetical protein
MGQENVRKDSPHLPLEDFIEKNKGSWEKGYKKWAKTKKKM